MTFSRFVWWLSIELKCLLSCRTIPTAGKYQRKNWRKCAFALFRKRGRPTPSTFRSGSLRRIVWLSVLFLAFSLDILLARPKTKSVLFPQRSSWSGTESRMSLVCLSTYLRSAVSTVLWTVFHQSGSTGSTTEQWLVRSSKANQRWSFCWDRSSQHWSQL